MSVGQFTYNAGGITAMWAAGMRTVAVHRATDWDGQNGTFEEYTDDGGGGGDPGGGPRPDLVEGQESYSFSDSDTAAGYAYKVKLHSPGGKESDFSNIYVMTETTTEVIMQAQEIHARYVHPVTGQVGTFISWNPNQVRLTRDKFAFKGNRPYVAGTDWWLELLLGYKTEAGVLEGINLTGATEIVLTLTDPNSGVVTTRKLSTAEIVVLDQSTPHSEGGTEGHILIKFADTDNPAAGQNYLVSCETTDSGFVVAQFAGLFDVLEEG